MHVSNSSNSAWILPDIRLIRYPALAGEDIEYPVYLDIKDLIYPDIRISSIRFDRISSQLFGT